MITSLSQTAPNVSFVSDNFGFRALGFTFLLTMIMYVKYKKLILRISLLVCNPVGLCIVIMIFHFLLKIFMVVW